MVNWLLATYGEAVFEHSLIAKSKELAFTGGVKRAINLSQWNLTMIGRKGCAPGGNVFAVNLEQMSDRLSDETTNEANRMRGLVSFAIKWNLVQNKNIFTVL